MTKASRSASSLETLHPLPPSRELTNHPEQASAASDTLVSPPQRPILEASTFIMPGTPSALYSSVRLVLTPVSLVWSPIFAGTGEGEGSIHGPGNHAPASTHDVEKLKIAVRTHANFYEGVPLSFLFVTLAELNGAPTYLVHLIYATLFGLRVAHAELGMKSPGTAGLGRPIGAWGTSLVALLAGVYNFTLGYDSLNNFLGIN